MVSVCVHQRSDCSHASAPNANAAHSPEAAQIFKDRVNVSSFVEAEGNVFSLRESAACEVESEDCDVAADEVVDYSRAV